MHFTSTIGRLSALAICALPLFATAKENKNYNVTAFAHYKDMPVNQAASSQTRSKVSAQFPGWMLSTDKLSGAFTDINGKPVAAAGLTTQEKANNVLRILLPKLGVTPADWVQTKAFSSPKADFVQYKRQVAGHDVVFAMMSMRFTKSGALAEVKMKDYGTSDGKSIDVSAEDATEIATKDIAGLAVTQATVDANWAWFPIPHAGGYTLHQAWHFTVKGRIKVATPMILDGYVDATDGTLLYRTNDVHETGFDVTVKGSVYVDGTLHPATMQPLPDLQINTLAGSVFTDTAGVASDATMILPVISSVPLMGRWSTVIDSISGLTPEFGDTVSVLGTTFPYPTLAPSSDRHVNAYYHVNRVHNLMKNYYPTFTGMDFSLPTNVDLTSGTCNAFYDGTSINFYKASAQCYSFAEIGSIIYHEYGHGINDHFYVLHSATGSMMNGALNEGYADVWAMCVTANPIIGENSFTGYGGFIRRYDKLPHVYPLDYQSGGFFVDPHYNGEIIAGTWWDVGVNLGGAAAMTALYTEAMYSTADGADGTEGEVYHQVLIDALMADDNDADLSNGTPHYNEIIKAFARHGIYLEGETTFNHIETNNMAANTAVVLQATIFPTDASYLSTVKLKYRLNGTGTWNTVAGTLSGGNYSATIPGQSVGTTVEYYFIMYDALGVENGYFPITCNPNNGAWETTLPYQYGVGLPVITSNHFETSDGTWHIANNPGDNATAGKWSLGAPTAALFVSSFPSADHTNPSGTKCLRAGNGGGAGFGAAVADGVTTVLSPIFDLSSYTNPTIEYFRWFSNEQGQDNYKNDPWIVQVRDGSNTSSPWINVEFTYQSELEWRRRIFRVKQYLPTATQVQVRFAISDSIITNYNGNGQSLTTADLDDFSLRDNGDVAGVKDVVRLHATVEPNPANNMLNVHLTNAQSDGRVALYDASGRIIKQTTIAAGATISSLSTSDVAPGVYFVLVQTNEGIETKKVLVAH